MKQRCFLCGVAFGVMCAVPAVGAQVEAPSDSVVNLPAVEVVANRAGNNTPVAFSNITKSEIARVNTGVDVPFIIEQMPSVVSTSDAGTGVGYSALSIRGTAASRINVTANGIPINDAESHNVYWVNMPDLASSVRDIQVQRGVGVSTNGAGAFGGTVNMLTDFTGDTPYGYLSTSAGSYGTYKATVRAGSGLIADHWSFDVRLSRIASDGYIERASSSLWSYFAQIGYRNAVGTHVRLIAFGGKERTYNAWDYATLEDMEKYGRRYNPCGEYINDAGERAYYSNQFDNYAQYHWQLLVSQRLSDEWHVNAALHYTAGDGYYEQYKEERTLAEYGLTPFYVPAVDEVTGALTTKKVKLSDLVRHKNMQNGFGGFTFSANYEQGRVSAVAGGAVNTYGGHHFGQVAWVRNYVGALDPLQEYYRNKGDKFDANVYARANVDLGTGFSAYADLQYRHIHYSINGLNDTYDYNTEAMQLLDIERRYDFFNPKAGVTWQQGGHRAYASASVAHKEPVRVNFTDCDPDHMPRAERLIDYEAGYSWQNSWLSFGANLYFMDYKDQLVITGQLSDTGNSLSVNVPRSYRAGIELQAAVRPCHWFDWQANATLSRNRIRNFVEYIYEDGWHNPIEIDCGETPIAMSPAVVAHNAFNFHWRGARLSLLTRYVGKQYLSNAGCEEQVLKAYCVSDLHLGYDFGHIASVADLSIGLVVYNVFNANYFSNGYAASKYKIVNGKPQIVRIAGYAAQAPANVLATVTLRF